MSRRPAPFNVPHSAPHSEEAEHAVLGALLFDNQAFETVSTILKPEHFYQADHRAIYETISELLIAGKLADLVTVHDKGDHSMVYLNQLLSCVASGRAAQRHAELLVERWREREVMRLGSAVADEISRGAHAADGKPRPVDEVIDQMITKLLALNAVAERNEPRDISELVVNFVDDLIERYEGKTTSIQTGLKDLDHCTAGGGRPGELWVIGARPSMGKTGMVLTLSRNVGRKHQVLMLTQEDSLNSLTARHVAAAGRVNLADLRNPQRAPESMWEGVTEGVEALGKLHIAMDDQAALSIMDVRRKIQQVKRRHKKLSMVVIDYLQLMEGDGSNRNQELGKIANGLKRAAKEFGVWIILLSQMNREADKRTGPPQMSDLRDSGDIEGAADLIGLLHREHRRNPTEANKMHAELHVVKHKNGPTDTLNFTFDGAYQRFTDWEGPAPAKSIGRVQRGGGLD
ncbi:DnaB-like helicase C-terminal domain-containing protein [Rhizobacter sp. SG703]|uniref:replicative DNA helicase n=1 Tax=Rhizobacter sp. SG703 TaxID=2587140 RepID=UPI0014464302|nr:DnaB-like helicase C-terminal domain-containing protein [Rhizobacter sp. SG703]NKI94730.1 replicative DNA helicase [Rhizobacter sp. SG703]